MHRQDAGNKRICNYYKRLVDANGYLTYQKNKFQKMRQISRKHTLIEGMYKSETLVCATSRTSVSALLLKAVLDYATKR